SSFSGAPLTTRITYPADGAINADITQPIQWLGVPNAQAYELYVGSSPGGCDLLDSGQIQATSRPWSSVPANQDRYAGVWVEVGGVWRYTDSSFSGARLTTQITYPANGAVNADITQSIQWLAVSSAQAYQLWVGSAAGGYDLLRTAEIQATSYPWSSVPANQTVYARIWMKAGGVWRYTDSSFSGAALPTRITYPANGATNADMSLPIQWASIPNAQAYVLWLGSTAGTHDLVTTSEALQTSYLASNLPANRTVYALI